MKYIKMLAYTALVASMPTTLKPIKITLKKGVVQKSPALHDVLTQKQVIDSYKTKLEPLTKTKRAVLTDYYNTLLNNLITKKRVDYEKIEAEHRSIGNYEASDLFYNLMQERIRATSDKSTQDDMDQLSLTF